MMRRFQLGGWRFAIYTSDCWLRPGFARHDHCTYGASLGRWVFTAMPDDWWQR